MEVKTWWTRHRPLSLADCLYIPESKRDELRHNFPDEMEQKKQMIVYWINTDPLASWRRLIRALDRMGETELANFIRSNAEPLAGIVIPIYIIYYLHICMAHILAPYLHVICI